MFRFYPTRFRSPDPKFLKNVAELLAEKGLVGETRQSWTDAVLRESLRGVDDVICSGPPDESHPERAEEKEELRRVVDLASNATQIKRMKTG